MKERQSALDFLKIDPSLDIRLNEKNPKPFHTKSFLAVPIKGLTKRYSNLKNLINDRSDENSNFLDKVLNVKGIKRPEEIKAQEERIRKKKEIKNIVSFRLRKYFKLWENYSRRNEYNQHFDKLKQKTFLSNSNILEHFQFISMLNHSDWFRFNEKIFESIDLKELLINPKKIVSLIQMDINKQVFNFLADLKKDYDSYLELEPGQVKAPNREMFFKKRTHSFNFNQLQIILPVENDTKGKRKKRNLVERFLLFNIIKFFEDLYLLNLKNFKGFLEVIFFFFNILNKFIRKFHNCLILAILLIFWTRKKQ